MLDGLLGRGFGAKCKSLIKLTKSRIEVIRRKRNATLKFLKKDMADLLANGLDINAYGRAEGLLVELTVSYSYDCVEEYCDFVLKHLTVMQKMRHCPEDCREAVSSLMVAAARFSDLPELRDLRQIFFERYGNTVELFVNQKFVENLSSKPFTKEKKIELMHKIAAEFSIRWDSRTCEQMMSKDSRPSSVAQEQPKGYGSFSVTKDESKSTNGWDAIPKADKHDIPSKDSLANGKVVHIWLDSQDKNVPKRNEFHQESRHEPSSHGRKLENFREAMTPKRENHEYLSQVRREANIEMREPWKEDVSLKSVKSGSSSERKGMEIVDGGSKKFVGENTTPKRDGQYISNQGKGSSAPSYAVLGSKNDGKESILGNSYFGSQHNIAYSSRNGEEEIRKLKPYYNNAIPPPYTKPNGKLKDNYEGGLGSSDKGSGINVFPRDPTGDGRNDAGNRSEKFDTEVYYGGHEVESIEHARANGHKHPENGIHQDDSVANTIPKPRSSRRRQSKSRSNCDNAVNEDTGGIKRRSRSRRRDDSRRGLQVLFDDEHHQNDEEERMIDKLLIHYSMKPSAHEPGQVRRKSKIRHSHHKGPQAEESPTHTSRDEPEEFPEVLPPRSISLPREQTAPSEGKKVFARAATFQADRSNEAKHVHPKLPDYDDLAARFAAMKGEVNH